MNQSSNLPSVYRQPNYWITSTAGLRPVEVWSSVRHWSFQWAHNCIAFMILFEGKFNRSFWSCCDGGPHILDTWNIRTHCWFECMVAVNPCCAFKAICSLHGNIYFTRVWCIVSVSVSQPLLGEQRSLFWHWLGLCLYKCGNKWIYRPDKMTTTILSKFI